MICKYAVSRLLYAKVKLLDVENVLEVAVLRAVFEVSVIAFPSNQIVISANEEGTVNDA